MRDDPESQTTDDYEWLKAHTGSNCAPSIESVEELRQADLVLLSGQFVGAGKSTFISALEEAGRFNVASWTNRDLRPGETEGIDKCHRPLGVMAAKAMEGFFLELEEVRPGTFYATPAEFKPGRGYVKDLELKGAMRLRSFAPDLPIIVPLPPLRKVDGLGVTEWERRIAIREGFTRTVTEKSMDDLKHRLLGVVDECERIVELGLLEDPNTLVVINDELETALSALRAFLATREKPTGVPLELYLAQLHDFARDAVQAYGQSPNI